jgi:hypothetical protein
MSGSGCSATVTSSGPAALEAFDSDTVGSSGMCLGEPWGVLASGGGGGAGFCAALARLA